MDNKLQSYPAPKRGRCRKGYKKNIITKMCDPLSQEKTEKILPKKLMAYPAPKQGRCKKGYTKNKTSKMCEPLSEGVKKKLVLKSKPIEMSKPKQYNGEFIMILKELETFMRNTGEVFRARAYQKAAESIIVHNNPIHSIEDIKNLPNIGKTIIEKLEQYINTGKIKQLEDLRNNPINLFVNVYGIGPKKAAELVKKGYKTIDDLRKHQDELNDKQKTGLKYYNDLIKRIPRAEIDQYKDILMKQFQYPESDFKIVGSYRRGASSSGDIDIILTNENNNTGILKDFVNKLESKGIILEILASGKSKCLVIGKLNDNPARRIDFLFSSPKEYPFAILYFTGSALFNTVMRQHALNMNLTLNEHGFHSKIKGTKGKAIDHVFKTEKDIFNYLNLEYKSPNERINGSAVISKVSMDDVEKKPKKSKKNITLKKNKLSVSEYLQEFQSEGIHYLETLETKTIEDMIKKASDAYYNSEDAIISDNQFDIIKEFLEKKQPTNKVLKEIGAPVIHKKVDLPYEMWSMDKIKPDTNALEKWLAKFNDPEKYVVSAKLDGVSGLYTVINNVKKLYTRGNGTIGQDISHLIPYLNLPDNLDKNIVVRGEFLISKSNFRDNFPGASNSRNTVAGLINKLTLVPEKLKYIDFVVYECIKPELSPSQQMIMIDASNFICVLNKVKSSLTNEFLSALLVEWRESYQYDIDGIIVSHDKIYPRLSKNPEHSFAFKMVLSDQMAEAKVVNVLWSASKDGFLKPRIQIEPIELAGVKIEYATAFNAAFVLKNKLGIGAIVKIIRSGDVIPYIMEVTDPAPEAKMPQENYIWNNTKIDILLVDSDNNMEVRFKRILKFFKDIDVSGLGPGNIKKIIDAGYDNIPSILAMSKENFLEVEGFKEKTADKLFINIKNKIDKIELPRLMKASNIFGRGLGEKKIEPILDAYPDILISQETSQDKKDKLLKLKGLAEKTVDLFVDNIENFKVFLIKAKLMYKLEQYKKISLKKEGVLSNKTIIFTGFRNSELERKIKENGGKIGSSVSKSTTYVLYDDNKLTPTSDKYYKAKELNILMPLSEFIKTFNLKIQV